MVLTTGVKDMKGGGRREEMGRGERGERREAGVGRWGGREGRTESDR